MKIVIDKIMDAVSKLEGEWRIVNQDNDEQLALYQTSYNPEFPNDKKGDIHRGFTGFNEDKYLQICTREEFLATVAECENDFGMCGRGEWVNYVNASKELLTKDLGEELAMDIDWSKAPEGATHCWKRTGSFYKFSKHDTDFVWHNCEWQQCADIGCFKGELTEKPQPAPTFTQEMADNGVLPSVGMECQTSTGILTIKYVGQKVVVSEDSEGMEFMTSIKSALHSFKPLTQPIPLINGAAYQFYVEETANIFHAIWSKERQQMCTEHSYFDKRFCEGIQPLTVEVK